MPPTGEPPVTTFRCFDVSLLRAAVRPNTPPPADGQLPDAEALRAAARDPLLREALAISSPALVALLDKVVAGEPVAPKRLRKALRAVSRYRLRMVDRATPFGVLAGVTTADFGPDPTVRWGPAHAKSVRVDTGWLFEIVTELERDETVLRGLRVTANDLCFVRGGQLVVPHRLASDPGGRGLGETSVEFTAQVGAVLAEAARPVPFARLAAERTATGLLTDLVGAGALVTELRPALDERDPLEHVLDLLADGRRSLSPRSRRTVDLLAEVRTALADYARAPLGAARAELAAVTERMARLRTVDRPVHAALKLDLVVRLPELVRTEVERAGEALWRLSAGRPGPEHLVQYHHDFWARYGRGRAVPLHELLDADRGLGAPAGYTRPRSARRLREGSHAAAERDALLLSRVEEASLTGEREILLDDDLLGRLGGDLTPPPSFDLLVQLLADSVPALAAGDFRLVTVSSRPLAGSYAGRFAALLGPDADRIGELVRTLPTRNPEAFRAQLTFPSTNPRGGNVVQVPIWSDHRIALGDFADRGEPRTLGLADLAVVADRERLALVSLRSGREVVPTMPFMLATQRHAPNVARFLNDVARGGEAVAPEWHWGAAETLPYLPRVRRGRTVLASARWRPLDAELRDPGLDFDEWRKLFDRWRTRWNVPERVQSVSADHRIGLDLDSAAQLALLQHEWSRDPGAHLAELPAGGDHGTGWLAPAGGDAPGHASELVFSLVRRTPTGTRLELRPPLAKRRVFAPGSEWLFAKVYSSHERHGEILARHLPGLLDRLPAAVDRWFFLRYHDEDAHLRLRFHGEPVALAGELLPALNAWTGELREAGLGDRLVLDTYDPEWERYGGPDALSAAEAAFDADSRACVEQLALLDRGALALDRVVLAAANYADLSCRLLGEGAGIRWLLDAPADSARGDRSAGHHGEGRLLIDPAGGWERLRGLAGGPELLAVFDRRAPAVTAYRDRLRGIGEDPAAFLPAVLHMNHNRLHGIDADHEGRALALARAALRTRAAIDGARGAGAG